MNYLPSRKFIWIISSIFGVIILIFITGSLIGRKEKIVSTGAEAAPIRAYAIKAGQKETLSELVSKDSDGDTVMDWEESLWGTNPNKKDTDGNGILDGIEINNKKKTLRESGGYPAEETNLEDLNETERFSREFFTTFIALRESGNLSPEAVTNLSISLASNIDQSGESPSFFNLKDLKINSDPAYGPKDYASTVKAVANKFAGQKIGYEMEILAKGISEGNERAMTELSAISGSYKNMATEFKNVSVPSVLAQKHLIFINSAMGISSALKELSQGLTNPLGAMPALSQYDTFSRSFMETATEIDNLLK